MGLKDRHFIALTVGNSTYRVPKHPKTTLFAVLSTVVAVGFVAGCGNSISGKASNQTATGNASSPSTKSGTIIDGLFEEPANLNPIIGPDSYQSVDASLYRNLFMVNPQDQLVPQMATVVPTVVNGGISKDGLTYTFHLDPKAKWSNGQPFISKDVWVTWKLITNPAVNAVSTLGWSDIKTFQIVNDHEFIIHLKQPEPGFIANAFSRSLPGILPYSVFGKMNPKDVNTASFNHDPTVTNGPYKFVSWSPGASIQVTANQYWNGPKPKTSNIDFKIISDQNTLLTNAKAHAINVWEYSPITLMSQVQSISGAQVYKTVEPAVEIAAVNMRNPILQDVRVRRALELAINRQALVQQVWKGEATLAAADQSNMSWTSNPNLKPYPYDPNESKKLLAEAGWKMGSDGYLHKNGQTFSLVYATTAGNATREATERLVQYWFKQVGIKMTIKNYPANQYFGTVLPSGQGWDLAEFEFGDSPDPASKTQSLFTSSGVQNYGSFQDSTVNQLMSQVAVTVEQSQRQKMMQQVESILHDQLPALWYYYPDELDTTIGISGYQPNPWNSDTWNVYDWQLK